MNDPKMSKTFNTIKAINDLVEEIENARHKFPGNDLLTIALMEEVGELSKALLDESLENVYREAIQVACVAIRIATEGDCSVNTYRAARFKAPI